MASTEVSDFEVRKTEREMAALDDETLLFVMLGVLMERPEGWRFTVKSRMLARVAFMQVCARWIPPEPFAAAFNSFTNDEGGADDA